MHWTAGTIKIQTTHEHWLVKICSFCSKKSSPFLNTLWAETGQVISMFLIDFSRSSSYYLQTCITVGMKGKFSLTSIYKNRKQWQALLIIFNSGHTEYADGGSDGKKDSFSKPHSIEVNSLCCFTNNKHQYLLVVILCRRL